jgi:hypothetical protein
MDFYIVFQIFSVVTSSQSRWFLNSYLGTKQQGYHVSIFYRIFWCQSWRNSHYSTSNHSNTTMNPEYDV